MVNINKINELFLRVDGDTSILYELNDEFSFLTPGYKYMPKYKAGVWDGYTRLFNVRNKALPSGLIGRLISYLKKNNHEYTVDPALLKLIKWNKELAEFKESIPSISKLSPTGKFQFQYDLFEQAMKFNKSLILSPTGSGKSHIIYFLCRFLLKYTEEAILIVVPTVSLVHQLESDFATYVKDDFSVTQNCHRIYAGQDKNPLSNPRIWISTWQSAYVMPKEWFDRFDTFICDEAHQADTKSISNILSKMQDARYKFGLTGTIEDNKIHQLTLTGWFGPILASTHTKDLMESGVLSNLAIEIKMIQYPQEDVVAVHKTAKTYQDEIKWLVQQEKRNNFIIDLAFAEPRNTLVLFNLVEGHGKVLYDLAVERAKGTNKTLYFIHGGVDSEKREEYRKIIERSENCIIFASYGVFSVGVNLKNLHAVIFAHPYKAKIKNLQSIGRVLRTNFNKAGAKLIDIGDNLSYNKKPNITLLHLFERIKIYKKERFDFEIEKITL